jgi:ERCC4-related helicase
MNKVIQWEIKCMKCSFALLSSDEVVFHKENEKSVHLLVEQQKIVVQGDEKNNEPAAITIHTNSKGKILRKIRNTHLSKATYSPFKLLCVHCEEAIGSQGPVRGKGDLEYRLEYRKCTLAWQNLKHEFESPVYKPGCKWAKALELLTRLRISINLSYMQLPENLSCESESNEPRSPQNDPIVTPTIDYLTQHFSPNCRISQMRKYQVEMAIGALMQDTVIYLPTGCGKTLIGVKVIQEMKKSNPMKVAVFLVPTVPLVAQQAAYVRRESDLRVAEFSGQSKGPRLDSGAFSSLHTRFDVLVMTPQYLLNQLTDQSVVIEGFCVLIFDEAHHATGDHPYNNILRLLYATELRVRPRIIGLTASPFSNKWNERSTNKAFDRILASFYNASLDTPTLYEDDLEQYSIPKEARWITVKETKQETSLRRGLKLHIASFERMINTLDREGNMIECSLLGNYDRDENEMSFFIGRLRKFAEAVEKKDKNGPLYIIAEHLVQIAATLRMLSVEGASKVAEQLKCFFEILARPTTALLTQKHVLTRVSFEKHLLPILAEFDHANKSESSSLNCGVEEKCSSRVLAIQQIIGSMKFGRDSRAIIFVRRRSTAKLLARALSEIPSLNRLNPTKFVGQHFYEGMSWEEEQKPTLESFRMGRTRLLIATNVLEEGLDVPQCSLVILFDGLHGITSLVQSRGRARKRDGEFVILCSEEELVSQKEALRRERAMNVSVRQHARKLPFKYVLANTLQQIWNKPFPVSLSPNNVLKSDKNDSEMDEQVCEIEGKSLQNIRLVGFENLQQQIQEWILKAIRIFLSIRFFDKQWSLLSVQVPEKGDFGQLYDAFCRHLDYSLIHKTDGYCHN